jgi:hypothetical protein
MGDWPFSGHPQAVLAGGGGQCLIPPERPGPGGGASLIGQRKQLLRFGLKHRMFSALQILRSKCLH